MITDGVVLTSYFSERRRINGLFVGDELIELYRTRSIASSIMLRGIQGFGPEQRLRTDTLLSFSEDLPVSVSAIDSVPNIEAVMERSLELSSSGLATVDSVQFLNGEISPVGIEENVDEATKLTIYCGSQDQVYAVPAFEAICELLHRRGVQGATVVLGVDGTAHGRRQRPQFHSRDADAPLAVIAVGSGHEIGMLLPDLGDFLRHPVMTLGRVRLCKRDGHLISRPEQVSGVDDHGFPLYQKITIYTSAAARHNGQPIHRAIARHLHSAGIVEVITHRGIWGFRGDRLPHGDKFLHFTRHIPVVTTVIGSADHASAVFDVVDELTSERGLVTGEAIPVIKFSEFSANHI